VPRSCTEKAHPCFEKNSTTTKSQRQKSKTKQKRNNKKGKMEKLFNHNIRVVCS